MGLGPTLVGGAIGAAAGVALHLIVERATGFEAPWFAIVIGLLTGLGVHQANKSLRGRVSYVRGAVAAGIALAAIVGSTPLISMVAARRSTSATLETNEANNPAQDVDNEQSAAGAADEESGDQRATDTTRLGANIGVEAHNVAGRPESTDFLQLLYMAAGTFIAYEFGRGGGPRQAKTRSPESGEPAPATDPSD